MQTTHETTTDPMAPESAEPAALDLSDEALDRSPGRGALNCVTFGSMRA